MIDMKSVALSSKYQIAVPLDVREPLGLKPRALSAVFRLGRMIQDVPVPALAELQAQLRGCGSDLPQETISMKIANSPFHYCPVK